MLAYSGNLRLCELKKNVLFLCGIKKCILKASPNPGFFIGVRAYALQVARGFQSKTKTINSEECEPTVFCHKTKPMFEHAVPELRSSMVLTPINTASEEKFLKRTLGIGV
jgi:hypothetical protein